MKESNYNPSVWARQLVWMAGRQKESTEALFKNPERHQQLACIAYLASEIEVMK
jgi:hypothetical protein